MSTARLKHRTVAESAAAELRRRILSGDFPEGFQLKQEALSAEFGISRIPLREALVLLESEGFVRILPHRGAVVSELSSEDITELYELRALLEPQLLRRSIPALTTEDFASAARILAEYNEELHAKHPQRWGELNNSLHQLLLSKADQPKTLAIVKSLLQQTDRYTRLQLSLSTDSCQRAEEEHGELIRLARAGDVGGACALLKRHILHAGEELRDFVLSRRKT